MTESYTGNDVIDESVNTISYFAQHVHNTINNLNDNINNLSYDMSYNFEMYNDIIRNDIYQKFIDMGNIHEDIYTHISELENKSYYNILCIPDSDNSSNILVIEEKNKNQI